MLNTTTIALKDRCNQLSSVLNTPTRSNINK